CARRRDGAWSHPHFDYW
nr:immunoglobulin heavy chain junction region [Macaca mulatta]MOW19644.1 immunoglobulin heavy chain junction region [Macaca mulatta]MOW20738.1 immunoglobulin heavy chain junction region [Macaca mulatta]